MSHRCFYPMTILSKIVNDLKNEKNKGDDVVTTLDLSLQQVAYNALGNNQGVVLAIEPSTGKILAMVSKRIMIPIHWPKIIMTLFLMKTINVF